MWNRFRMQRSPLVVPASLLALAVLVGAPQAALAQDGYMTLRGTSEALAFDPTNPALVSNTVALGGVPSGVAISPDGTTAYVIVATFVYRIVAGVLDPTPVSPNLGGLPEQITVGPDGTKLFITNTGNNSKVHVVDVATGALVNKNFTAGSGVWGIDASTTPGGDRVYVSLSLTDEVKVLDAAGNLLATLTVGDGPQGVAAAPQGDRVYVANGLDGSVSVIDTTSNAVFSIAGVGSSPQELTVSADGTRLYVTLRGDGDVAVIDTTTNTVVDRVAVGAPGDSLHGISFSADGAFVVAAHFGTHKISVIDPGDNNSFVVTGPLTGAARPRYVAYPPLAPADPDTPPVFNLPVCDAAVAAVLGEELTVDISVVDDVGSIVTLTENPANNGELDAPFETTSETPVTNTFRWTPTAADPAGDYELIFEADDEVNDPVSCTVTITVPEPPLDLPPTVESEVCGTTISATLGEKFTFMIDARDDNLMTLSVDGLPGSATMAPELSKSGDHVNSKFSWTPTGADAGTHVITFTADDGVNPAASCAVTIVVPEPPEPEDAEFTAFRLRFAKISRRGRFADSFWFNGNFSLDRESGNDIDPVAEDVRITIEGTEWTIPAGAFRSRWRGRMFRFRGTIGGTRLLVYITRRGRQGSGRYNINVSGWKGTFSEPQNPLEMCVTIGDDFGCAEKKRGWIR